MDGGQVVNFRAVPIYSTVSIGGSLQVYQSLKADFSQYYSRTETEFLPWAFTDNSDAIVWLIDDDPNEWCVYKHLIDRRKKRQA